MGRTSVRTLALAIGASFVLASCSSSEPLASERGVPFLQEVACNDGGDCGVAYGFGGRAYALGCDEVRAELLGETVAIRNDDDERAWAIQPAEAKRIRGADPTVIVAMGPLPACGTDGAGDRWHWANTAPVEDEVLCRVLVDAALDC